MIRGTLTDEDEAELLEELDRLQQQNDTSKQKPEERPEEKELDLPKVPSTEPQPGKFSMLIRGDPQLKLSLSLSFQ